MQDSLIKFIHLVKNHARATTFFVVVIFLLYVFQTAIEEQLSRVLHEERYSHAPLVFCMALYLIWIKRFEIKDHNQGAWLGVGITIVAGVAVMIGELSAIWTIVQYGMLLLCLGLAWTMIGHQIKKILVPFLHLFLVIPLPYMLDVMLSGKMQLVSSNLGVAISRLLGMSVYQDGNVIDLGIYKLQVVEACSGLNYMYPLMTIGLMLGYMYKAPFYSRAVLFLSSIPISIVMNSFRIAIVAMLVNHSGIAAAEGFMHYFEGWVIFIICIGLLLLEAKLMNIGLKMNHRTLANSFDYLETTGKTEALDAKTALKSRIQQAPILAGIAIVLLASISTLSLHHRDEIVPARKAFASYPMLLDGWQGHSYAFKNGENDILKLKDYFLANFSKANAHIDVYLGYTDSQRNGFVPHSPKACIPGGGWEITDTRLQAIRIDSKTSFKVTRMLISKGEEKQLIYYWFHQRGRDLSNEFPMKFALLYDAIKRNRTDGAIVRFTTAVNRSETTADTLLTDFIRINYPLFPKFIPI